MKTRARQHVDILFTTLALLAFCCRLSAAGWEIETIDASGVGRYSSLKLDKDGNAHVAYVVDDDRHELRYAFWDRLIKRWFSMTVAPYASFCSLTLDSKQRPHISYADFGSGKGTKLRYASWDGSSWKTQAIPLRSDAIAYYTSIALVENDWPVISYYEYEGPGGVGFVLRLRAVSWNGNFWEARTVDQSGGSGKFNSIAIDSSGYPQIAYANVKAENAGLRYARWNGQSWETEILEGKTGPYPIYSVAVIIDKQNVPHVSYMDLTLHLVKYATNRGGKWQLQTIDTFVKEAYPDRNGITVDDAGNPYVSYYDAGLGRLKVAYQKGANWVTEVVDANLTGFSSSIQIGADAIWVTYADEAGAGLKCARKLLDPAVSTVSDVR